MIGETAVPGVLLRFQRRRKGVAVAWKRFNYVAWLGVVIYFVWKAIEALDDGPQGESPGQYLVVFIVLGASAVTGNAYLKRRWRTQDIEVRDGHVDLGFAAKGDRARCGVVDLREISKVERRENWDKLIVTSFDGSRCTYSLSALAPFATPDGRSFLVWLAAQASRANRVRATALASGSEDPAISPHP